MEYVSDDADEEDFDMDVDVFSPLQPTLLKLPTLPKLSKTRNLQRQPPLPDYLPLEVKAEKEQASKDQQVAVLGKSPPTHTGKVTNMVLWSGNCVK